MGARFSAPVQTGAGAYPASCTMGTGSSPGVKRPGCGADHPLPPKRRGHERVQLYLYSPSGPSWPVIGRTLPFYPQFLSDFNENLKFLDRFPKNIKISNFMKIRPVGAELFRAHRRIDGHTDMTMLVVAFRKFANEPRNCFTCL